MTMATADKHQDQYCDRMGAQLLTPFCLQMIKGLLSDEQNSRLEAVELERTLNHMMDAVYCPRCSTISLEDQDNCAQCSKCFYVFCSLCNESWHPGSGCLNAEDKLELMRRRMAGNKSGEQEFRRREQELQSLAHIQVACHPLCTSLLLLTGLQDITSL